MHQCVGERRKYQRKSQKTPTSILPLTKPVVNNKNKNEDRPITLKTRREYQRKRKEIRTKVKPKAHNFHSRNSSAGVTASGGKGGRFSIRVDWIQSSCQIHHPAPPTLDHVSTCRGCPSTAASQDGNPTWCRVLHWVQSTTLLADNSCWQGRPATGGRVHCGRPFGQG